MHFWTKIPGSCVNLLLIQHWLGIAAKYCCLHGAAARFFMLFLYENPETAMRESVVLAIAKSPKNSLT